MARPQSPQTMARSHRPIGRALGGLLLVGLLVGGILLAGIASAQAPIPPVKHPVQGREACTQCHGATGPLALPATHQGRTDQTCLMCHAVAGPTPNPTATPRPTPTPTPMPQPTPTSTPVPPGVTPQPTPTSTPTPTPLPSGATPTPTPTLTPTPTPQAQPTPAPAPPPQTGETCLLCHGNPGLTKTFPNGDTRSLAVSADVFRQSVHGSLLLCQDCHRGYQQVPHPPVGAISARDYAIAQYEVCKRCHFANYTKTLDSIHFEVLSAGNLQAPVCTDCHGAHDVSPPTHPRSRTPQTCAQCHPATFATYLDSVHGRALVDQDNQDVPTCTYCHGVHNIQNPRTTSFRLDVPQVCGSCHADRERMERYGLSTAVVRTYLQDFHGVTVSLARRKESPDILSYEAVCTDCHGIHNIASTKGPSSPLLKAHLVETCRQCHPGATENFPSAWLSHYEPSLKHAPMVFLVKIFYRVLIPMMVVGLSIHIGLNLWRSAMNR